MAKNKHPYTQVCSITSMKFFADVTDKGESPVSMARVWRRQRSLGPWELENMDLYKAVEGVHPHYVHEIAKRLADVEGVMRVEVVRWSDGEGIMIEG